MAMLSKIWGNGPFAPPAYAFALHQRKQSVSWIQTMSNQAACIALPYRLTENLSALENLS